MTPSQLDEGVRPTLPPDSHMPFARRLLWIDCSAGLLAGLVLLASSRWLSPWYALPRELLVAMGTANLLYAGYSFSLARQGRRRRWRLLALIAANAGWAVGCVIAALWFARTASVFGLAHLVLEGAFVGALAAAEWMQRERLLTAA